jgi:hypothetical protein
MKKIKLTKSKYALVDNEDYPYLNRFNWVYANGHASMQVSGHNIYMEFL